MATPGHILAMADINVDERLVWFNILFSCEFFVKDCVAKVLIIAD
jgi:hypothetical protein